MSPSFVIMLFSILFWGWINQIWLMAFSLILVVCFNLLTKWRWDLTLKQFYRFSDMSLVLSIVYLAYGYLFQSEINPIFSLLKWLPVLFFPLLFAQLYSTRSTLPTGALFYYMRSAQNKELEGIDFTLPFSCITILASGAANVQTSSYFILSVILISLILWFERPGQANKFIWLLLISIAIGVSHWGHNGLKQLHAYIQEISVDWLSNWATDPFKSTTSIGQIGNLKLSDKIEFRVRGDEPLLLHQSSYDRYIGDEWYASKRQFRPYTNKKNRHRKTQKQLDYFHSFSHDAILALPDGSNAIHGLEGAQLQQTDFRAVKIKHPPAKANYQVLFSGIKETKDSIYDLEIPRQHREWLQTLSAKLKLHEKSPEQKANAIKKFFQTEYFYTLFTPKESDANEALKEFVLVRKAGHCEYFAIASVFLLRYSGIPARLANGYSMQEYDESLDMYVVRRRHSHAWAIAKINNIWQPVDSTPSQWLDIENDNASLLQPVWDWFSRTFFRFSQWRSGTEQLIKHYALWGAFLILVAYGSWLFYNNRKRLNKRRAKENEHQSSKTYPGLDSEFFIIERYFQQLSQVRPVNESFYNWIKNQQDPNLDIIIQLHYRYRFDPNGLSKEQRDELKFRVEDWIKAKQSDDTNNR